MKNDNQYTEGCPRCDDYDEVVEELKKEKEHRDRESKEALRKCEENHKKKDAKIQGLQKKILTMTIAAVVGGTIVGKDVIDKIAAYIESFNSVKNAASGLVSMKNIGEDSGEKSEKSSQEESPNDSEEKESFLVKDDTKKDDLFWDGGMSTLSLIDMTPNYPASSFMLPYEDMGLVSMITDDMLHQPMLFDDMMGESLSLSELLMDFTTLGSEMDDFNMFDVPLVLPELPYMESVVPTAYVPESGSWLCMMAAASMVVPRRRRR